MSKRMHKSEIYLARYIISSKCVAGGLSVTSGWVHYEVIRWRSIFAFILYIVINYIIYTNIFLSNKLTLTKTCIEYYITCCLPFILILLLYYERTTEIIWCTYVYYNMIVYCYCINYTGILFRRNIISIIILLLFWIWNLYCSSFRNSA